MLETFESYTYDGRVFDMKEWLKDAEKLNDLALERGEIVLEKIPKEILNCRKLIGWLQRAIVLSYYYLLRHASYQEANDH
jgi:hypothetical protein